MNNVEEVHSSKPKHQDRSIAAMHTTEHILNQTMVRMFGCERSKNSHIERKKSKCDYNLPNEPSEVEISAIEQQVNEVIGRNLPIETMFVDRHSVPASVDLSKLPQEAEGTIRLVSVGDYDLCACIGEHVGNTSEIGAFKIISYDYADNKLRLRFKIL